VREFAPHSAMLAGVALVDGDEVLGETADVVPETLDNVIREPRRRFVPAARGRGWQNLLNPFAPTIEISEYVCHLHGVHVFAPLENGGQRRSDSTTRAAEATWFSNHYSKDGAGIGRRDCVLRRIG